MPGSADFHPESVALFSLTCLYPAGIVPLFRSVCVLACATGATWFASTTTFPTCVPCPVCRSRAGDKQHLSAVPGFGDGLLSLLCQCCSPYQVDAIQTDWGRHPLGAYSPEWPLPNFPGSEPQFANKHFKRPSTRTATSCAFKQYLKRLMHPVTSDLGRLTTSPAASSRGRGE